MATAPVSAPASPVSAPKPVHPLRERNFRLLWMGSTVSLLGDQCYLVALPWLVLQITGSAVAMGAILMTEAIPRAVLMLMGGVVSDRVSPRKVMMTTAWTRTLFVAAIGALVWFHMLQVWELYLLAFAFGVADAFAMPASSAYLPSLVEPEQLVAANSVRQSTQQLTTIAGPAPAGVAIRVFGIAWAFFLDALSFLFIIAALWALPDPARAPAAAAKKPVWRSVTEGLHLVAKDVPLRSLLLVTTVMNFCIAGPLAVGLAYLVKIRFNSATAYGSMLSAAAAGGLLGAVLAGIVPARRRGWLILGVGAAIGLCLLPLGMLRHLWQIGALLLLMGACAGLANVHIIAWIQQRIERAVRGRVMSVIMFAAFGLLPFSLAAAGLLVVWSLQGMFLLAGLLMIAACAVAALPKQVRAIE